MKAHIPALFLLSSALVAMASACGGSGDSLFAPAGAAGANPAGAGGNAGKGGGSSGTGGSVANGGAGHGGTTSTGGQPGNGGWGGTSSAGSGGASSGGWAGSGGSSATGGWGGSGASAGAGGCAADPINAPSQGSCVKTGTTGYPCNPVTNAGCNASAGDACDFDGSAFQCFPGTNTATPCGACNTQSGPFCEAGFTCFGGANHCTRYCCNNADCAPGTGCVMQYPTSLGICQTNNANALSGFKPGTGGSSGAGGSTGGSGGTGGSTCAHGSCVVGVALDMNCDTCVGTVCTFAATCCSTTWDSTCVQYATMFCQCTP